MVEHDLPLLDRFRWAEEILVQSQIVVAEADIRDAVLALAKQIKQDLYVLYPIVLSVMSGSVVFSSDLIRCLDFPVDFDYLDVSRYRQSLDPRDITWNVTPRICLHDRHVLLLDDILDQGMTLKAVYEWLVGEGVKSVRIAVLCQRQIDNYDVKIRPDYVGFKIYGSSFVFGYGMDIYGFWRNLPAIYGYDRNQVVNTQSISEDGFD